MLESEFHLCAHALYLRVLRHLHYLLCHRTAHSHVCVALVDVDLANLRAFESAGLAEKSEDVALLHLVLLALTYI